MTSFQELDFSYKQLFSEKIELALLLNFNSFQVSAPQGLGFKSFQDLVFFSYVKKIIPQKLNCLTFICQLKFCLLRCNFTDFPVL